MTNLDIAVDCLRRGWFVFPCKPNTKEPAIRGGVLNATDDEAQVRAWWERWPDANPAIATGPSGLCVLDCDHGLTDEGGFRAWLAHLGLPETYTVRTGRRDDFGGQLYFQGEGVKSIGWAEDGLEGDIRCSTGYVLAAGCTHPNGERYETLVESPLASMPHHITTLKSVTRAAATGGTNTPVVDDGGPITEHRNVRMISLLGRNRREGADDEALRQFANETNETRVVPPLDEDELERLITNACRFPVPEAEPEVVIGKPGPLAPVDWRTRYLTFEQVRDARPTEFLIDGFLALGSITALAAPVAQRKSLIASMSPTPFAPASPCLGTSPCGTNRNVSSTFALRWASLRSLPG